MEHSKVSRERLITRSGDGYFGLTIRSRDRYLGSTGARLLGE